jgi:hypothetical protein
MPFTACVAGIFASEAIVSQMLRDSEHFSLGVQSQSSISFTFTSAVEFLFQILHH